LILILARSSQAVEKLLLSVSGLSRLGREDPSALKCAKVRSRRQPMTLHRSRARPAIEIPIERIFRKIMRRKMSKAERRCFHLKAVP